VLCIGALPTFGWKPKLTEGSAFDPSFIPGQSEGDKRGRVDQILVMPIASISMLVHGKIVVRQMMVQKRTAEGHEASREAGQAACHHQGQTGCHSLRQSNLNAVVSDSKSNRWS